MAYQVERLATAGARRVVGVRAWMTLVEAAAGTTIIRPIIRNVLSATDK